jgi:hypothetical protein
MPRNLKPPFRFDVSEIVRRFRKLPVSVEGITITLPFVEMTVKPDDTERKVAREIVIRLADRRVLNAFECCDGCIENALKSLLEIRAIVVNKQVELSSKTDGALYLLLDSIREAIRQFLTFEQRLGQRQHESRELYFAGLEMLRAHIHTSTDVCCKSRRLATWKYPVLRPTCGTTSSGRLRLTVPSCVPEEGTT